MIGKAISLLFFTSIVAQYCNAVVMRNDRIWPIGGGASVDLPQSSAYGSKQYRTKYEKYCMRVSCFLLLAGILVVFYSI